MASRDDQERLYEQSPSEQDLRRRGRESAAKESEWPGHTGVYHVGFNVGFMQGAQYEAAHQRARYERLVKAANFIADQPCRMEAEGASKDFPCTETGACVTEMCFPCHLRAALADLREPEGGEPT